jgi:hypothetical protein
LKQFYLNENDDESKFKKWVNLCIMMKYDNINTLEE